MTSFSTLQSFMRSPNDRFLADCASSSFRVLYVGNDLAFLTDLRRIIFGRKYQFVSCMDCASAILFLKGNPRYDLLLFDLELCGPSIVELANLTRSLPHRRHLPIVVAWADESGCGPAAIISTLDADEAKKNDLAAIQREIERLL
jgi:CheY-like chemotaxis protein